MKVAAAVQAAPVFLDLAASLQKAAGLIEAAAANGMQLLVFPEAFLPAPPIWVDEVLPGEDEAWHVRLLEQSVVYRAGHRAAAKRSSTGRSSRAVTATPSRR